MRSQVKKLADTLQMHYKTSDILSNYPRLPTNIDSTTNKALASLLRAYMAPNVVTVLAGVRNDDGIGIILRLQKLYASTTMQDKLNAQEYLQTLHKSHLHNHKHRRRMIKTIAKLMLWSLSPHHSDQRCLLHPWQRYLQPCHNNMPSQ